MKYFIGVIILFTSILQTTYAELPPAFFGRLSGRVMDLKSGLPLSGATIYIADLKTGTNTNNNGEFSIANVSKGAHLI